MTDLPQTITLNNGASMPALGFGTFANEGSSGETHRAVVTALDAGYRHLDCAWFYQNEHEVGSGMKEFLSTHPSVKRSDIFITAKVWQHLHEPEDVAWSLNNSLEMLQTEYVDSFLIHWPIASEKSNNQQVKLGSDGKYIIKKELTENPEPTWRAMENLYRQGKARSIGVSNWTIAGEKLIKFCFDNDIVPVAYSPLGSQDQIPGTGEKVSTNRDLNAIASKNGVSLAQVLIAWGLRRGYAVLPKSSNEGRIRSNAQLIALADEDFNAVNKVAEGRCSRFVNMKDTFGYDVWPEEA